MMPPVAPLTAEDISVIFCGVYKKVSLAPSAPHGAYPPPDMPIENVSPTLLAASYVALPRIPELVFITRSVSEPLVVLEISILYVALAVPIPTFPEKIAFPEPAGALLYPTANDAPTVA